VSPEPLEAKFLSIPLIDQIFITSGDIHFSQSGVVAVIVPNKQLIESWPKKEETEGNNSYKIKLCSRRVTQ